MTKQLIQVALVLAVLLSVASATITLSTGSASATAFVNSTVNPVWTSSNATDTKWTNGFVQSLSAFGPAASGNSTVYAYGVSIATTAITFTSRAINTTILINGSSTAEGSLIKDYTGTAAPTAAATTDGSAAICVGLGSIALIYQDTLSGGKLQVFAVIYTATGTASSAIQLSKATTTTVTYQDLQCVYDQAGIYYFGWATQLYTAAAGANPATYADNGVYAQGVNTSNSNAVLWTAGGISPTTQPSGTGTATSSSFNLRIGLSNYTNATTVYLAYVVAGSATGLTNVDLTTITVSSGTAAGGSSVATGIAVTTPAAGSLNYMPLGFVTANTSVALLLSNVSLVTSGSVTTYSLAQYNITNSSLVASLASVPSSSSNTPMQAYGGTYMTGYYIVYAYVSATKAATYTIQGFNSTASVVASTTVASALQYSATADFTPNSPGNVFVDPSGGLWFGYTSYDATASEATTGLAIEGLLGEVWATTMSSSSSSSSVSLVSASLFLFALIAAIFAF